MEDIIRSDNLKRKLVSNLHQLKLHTIKTQLITDTPIPREWKNQSDFNNVYMKEVINDKGYKNLVLKYSHDLPFKNKLEDEITHKKIKIVNTEEKANPSILRSKLKLYKIDVYNSQRNNEEFKDTTASALRSRIISSNILISENNKDYFKDELEKLYEPISEDEVTNSNNNFPPTSEHLSLKINTGGPLITLGESQSKVTLPHINHKKTVVLNIPILAIKTGKVKSRIKEKYDEIVASAHQKQIEIKHASPKKPKKLKKSKH